MKRTIEINTQHIESIEVVEKVEHDDYHHYPATKSRWFLERDYPEIFIVESFFKYSREEISKDTCFCVEGDQLFFRTHLKIRMSSGKIHKIYFNSMGELKHKIDVLKVGIDEYNWKKILM